MENQLSLHLNYKWNSEHKIKVNFQNIFLPTSENDITDAELMQNFNNDRDNKWLGILLPRYTLLLLGVCMKYLKNEEDAKDAVQQVFLKVINELHKYKVDYFKSWIFMVARNHCLMKLRGHKSASLELNEDVLSAKDPDEGIAIHLEKEKLLTDMEEAMKELSIEQQQCVTLFYLKKKSYAEIAEMTGYTMLQVKSHLQNGKRNLKMLMGIT